MILTAALSFFFLLSFCAAAIGQTSPRKDFPGITIKNFGQMDERFYRGARPKEGKGQYEALKAIGVQTVIDLTDDAEPVARAEAEAAGLRYVNLPIIDKSYPTPEKVEAFLKLVDDPETGVFFLHCAGGRHRTGDMGAVYRFVKYGWDFDRAYREMKNYDFYSSWGHGKQKDFVEDYAVMMQNRRLATAAAAAATTP